MVERKLYAKDFDPLVQPGEYIEIFPVTPDAKRYYQCGMVYPQPLLSVDLCDSTHLNATLTTTESAEVEIDDIYVDDYELLHFRMIPRDDFVITWLAKPKARPYYITKNKTWQLQTILDDPRTNPAVENLQLNELFQFEDKEMWLKATSNTSTLTTARLLFFGWRLLLNPVSVVPNGIRPIKVPVEGYPGSSK